MSFFRRKIEPARPMYAAGVPRVDSTPSRAIEPNRDAPRAASTPQPAPATERSETLDDGLRILVVCTANVCRSPLGAALLATSFARRGVAASVTSAGVAAARLPVDPRSADYAARSGAEIWDHLPRQLDPELLFTDGRDLVLTMGREHLREAAVMAPRHLTRMFTLKEFARRSSELPAEPGERFAEWVARVGAGRRATDLLGEQVADEIPDPYGRSDSMFRDVAAEIDRLVADVVGRIIWFDELNPTKRGA